MASRVDWDISRDEVGTNAACLAFTWKAVTSCPILIELDRSMLCVSVIPYLPSCLQCPQPCGPTMQLPPWTQHPLSFADVTASSMQHSYLSTEPANVTRRLFSVCSSDNCLARCSTVFNVESNITGEIPSPFLAGAAERINKATPNTALHTVSLTAQLSLEMVNLLGGHHLLVRHPVSQLSLECCATLVVPEYYQVLYFGFLPHICSLAWRPSSFLFYAIFDSTSSLLRRIVQWGHGVSALFWTPTGRPVKKRYLIFPSHTLTTLMASSGTQYFHSLLTSTSLSF